MSIYEFGNPEGIQPLDIRGLLLCITKWGHKYTHNYGAT